MKNTKVGVAILLLIVVVGAVIGSASKTYANCDILNIMQSKSILRQVNSLTVNLSGATGFNMSSLYTDGVDSFMESPSSDYPRNLGLSD